MTTPILRPPGSKTSQDRPHKTTQAPAPTVPPVTEVNPTESPYVSLFSQQQNRDKQSANQAPIPPLYWFGGGLILISLIVIFVLPVLVDRSPPQGTPQHTSTVDAPPTEPPQTGQNDQQQQLAKQLLSQLLSLRATLEAENVNQWAADEYQHILQTADQAAKHFAKSRYLESVTTYQRTLNDLKDLRASKPTRLAQALLKGRQALAINDSLKSQQHFTLALALDPENQTAQTGLQRSQNRDQVLAFHEQSQLFISEGNPEQALAPLQEAIKLDPEYQLSKDLLEALETELQQAKSAQLISETEQALQKGKLSTARRLLRQLRQLDPEAIELTDLARRIQQRGVQISLNRLRKEGNKAASKEDWSKALSQYEAALKIDPKLSFAIRGKQQATQQIQLSEDINHYLKQPLRLSSDLALRNAKTLLEQLEQRPSPGPKRAKQIKQLRQLIGDAQTPIDVTITSDGLTNVTLYRVSKLGTLTQKSLQLRPGDYTLVGSREGYRDVRKTLNIRAKQAPLSVHIQCRESI